MMGANQPIDIDDREIRDGLKALQDKLGNLTPFYQDIGEARQQHPPPFRDPDRARRLALSAAIAATKSARRKQRQDSDAGGPPARTC